MGSGSPAGFGDPDAHTAARLAVRSYRTEMFRYASMRFLKVWYSRSDIDEVTRLYDSLQPRRAVERRRTDIARARRSTSLKAFLKMCDQVEGQYRIRPAHPVIVRYPIERHPAVLEELRHAIALYQETLPADRREVLRDMKGSMSVSLMDPHQLAYYGRLCGWALARAHARTGRASMISGYLGESEDFDQAIADFAIAYVGQNERDYQRLRRAISDARILATVEP